MHYPALDGLRAVAAISVVAFHVSREFLPGGFIGVDVFFVLSGYLIATGLAREKARPTGVDLTRFLLRRFARLYPLLLLVVAVFAAVAPWLFPEANVKVHSLWALSYLSNISVAFFGQPKFLQHTWSLAIEVQFYVTFAVAIALWPRAKIGHMVRVLIALFILSTLWRISSASLVGWRYAYYGVDTRVSALALGAAFALGRWSIPEGWAGISAAVSLLGLGMFAMDLKFYNITSAAMGPIVEIFSAVFIVSLKSKTLVSKALSNKLSVTLGTWSYGLYLWHYPVARLVRYDFEPAIAMLITLSASTVLAALTYAFFERPVKNALYRLIEARPVTV